MADVEVRWRGMAELLRALDRVEDAGVRGAEEFVEEVAEDVLKLSQVYVPVETGLLRSTGRVEGHGLHAEVVYGGRGVDYAVYVHEIPPTHGGRWGHGNKHKAPTRYKYLELAALETFAKAELDLYRHVGRRMELAWR